MDHRQILEISSQAALTAAQLATTHARTHWTLRAVQQTGQFFISTSHSFLGWI